MLSFVLFSDWSRVKGPALGAVGCVLPSGTGTIDDEVGNGDDGTDAMG